MSAEAAQLTAQSAALRAEADELLYGRGLLAALNKYGTAHITGSYYLDLMTWHDLDLYVDSSTMAEGDFFALGRDIAAAVRPGKMHYRDEFILESGLPRGFYWGIYTNMLGPDWKIDLWAVETSLCAQYMAFSESLRARLDDETRLAILAIKGQLCTHPGYRREFTSVDIYNAVLQDGVRDVEGFRGWVGEKKGFHFTC